MDRTTPYKRAERAVKRAQGYKQAEIWLSPRGQEIVEALRESRWEPLYHIIDRALALAIDAKVRREHQERQGRPSHPQEMSSQQPSTALPFTPARSSQPSADSDHEQIIDLLRHHPQGLSPAQVRKQLGLAKDPRHIMRHMATAGTLKPMARGFYTVAEG